MTEFSLAFGSPWFLLLLLLVPLIFLFSRRSLAGLPAVRRAVVLGLRCVVVILLVLALAEARFFRTNDDLAVIFVADLSESVPAEQRDAERRFINGKANDGRRPDDRVGVLAFGRVPGIELTPRPLELDLTSFSTLIEPEATNIGAAIRLATAAFPERHAKRIVLLSDGNQNSGSVVEEVHNARAQGVTIDVVPVTYEYPAEISVEKLIVDPEQNVGEPFDIRVVVDSTIETEVQLQLYENGQLVSGANQPLKAGKNVFDFSGRRIGSVGQNYYEARVEPLRSTDDYIFENNVAYGFTRVQGTPAVLFCADDEEGDQALLDALRAEEISVDIATPETLPTSIERYFGYDAIVLSDIPADRLSVDTMKMFESLVKTIGVGFVMIGGESSFGAGGYRATPIERLLPVEMDIKNKKVMPNGAIAFVVHSCELARGNYWAVQVLQQGIKILSPRDYCGVLYYGNAGDQWLFPMSPVSKRQQMLGLLQNFSPGDMMSFQNIMRMAFTGLQSTPASIKHLIVLSDGDPTPPPNSLLSNMVNAGITVSTICYGAHGTIPAAMKNMAAIGGGNYYFLQSPDDLPEIFIRETTTVTKSLISEEPFTPNLRSSHPILQGVGQRGMPPLNGYVLTTRKPLASVPLTHPASEDDPTEDPVLATWAYGVGKAVAFTSDAGRRWGGNWAEWSGFQPFWAQCLRWVMRTRGEERFRVTRSIEGDTATIQLDALSLDGRFIKDLDLQVSVVGPDFKDQRVDMPQTAPGSYRANFATPKKGTYTLSAVYERDGNQRSFVTGVSVPYSGEYRRLKTNHELLRQIADAGGGVYFDDPADAQFFRRDFEASYDVSDVWQSLVLAALAMFFIDVFVRRVAIDYRQAFLKAVNYAALLIGVRKRELAPTEGRLATLLERKAKLRESTDARYGGGSVDSPSTVETSAAPSEAASRRVGSGRAAAGVRAVHARAEDDARPVDAASALESFTEVTPERARHGADKPAKESAPAAEAEPSSEAAGSYTSRLLEAKKRALREKKEEDES